MTEMKESPTWKAWLTLQYSAGRWTELDGDPLGLDALPEGTDDKLTMRDLGYAEASLESILDAVLIWEAHKETEQTRRWRYVVWVNVSETVGHTILIPSLPDFLDLIPKLAALAGALKLDYFADTMMGMARKAFRAWHGHDPDGCCPECDPGRYRYQQAMRQQRETQANGKPEPEPTPTQEDEWEQRQRDAEKELGCGLGASQ